MKKKCTILFLGQKEIGERCFLLLYQLWQKKVINLVVCSNVSKDVWWNSNAIYLYCKEASIPFISNEARNDELINNCISSYGVSSIVSVQHNWILRDETLKLVKYSAFNLHLAKLPEYQGYNTFNYAILNKEEKYGVTIHWMTQQVDFGSVAYYREFSISKMDTAYSLYQKSVMLGEKLFEQLLVDMLADCVPKTDMIGRVAFYPKKGFEQYKLISSLENKSNIDLIARACFFPPFSPAYFLVDEKKYYVVPANDN